MITFALCLPDALGSASSSSVPQFIETCAGAGAQKVKAPASGWLDQHPSIYYSDMSVRAARQVQKEAMCATLHGPCDPDVPHRCELNQRRWRRTRPDQQPTISSWTTAPEAARSHGTDRAAGIINANRFHVPVIADGLPVRILAVAPDDANVELFYVVYQQLHGGEVPPVAETGGCDIDDLQPFLDKGVKFLYGEQRTSRLLPQPLPSPLPPSLVQLAPRQLFGLGHAGTPGDVCVLRAGVIHLFCKPPGVYPWCFCRRLSCD